MSLLEQLQSAASDYVEAFASNAIENISGQSTPLPAQVVQPTPNAQALVPVSQPLNIDASTMTMILGAAAIGAAIFFLGPKLMKSVKA